MSSRYSRLSKMVMVAAAPAMILAIVFLLPPALSAATDHSPRALSRLAAVAPPALPALPALPGLPAMAAFAALPAPPEPPEPPDPPAPRARHTHTHHDDGEDGEDEAQSAWLGVTLSEIDEEGTRVADVADDSPASDAGLEKGDRIIGIEGKKVISSRDVVRAVRSSSPGDKISIRIERDGDEKTLTATLAGRKSRTRHEFRIVTPKGEDHEFEIPDMEEWHDEHGSSGEPGHRMRFMVGPSRTWIGVELHPMSSELREALKAPSDKGLLINRVVEDSPAESAGLKAGDIIIAVGDKGVDEVGDIGRAIGDREAGDSVEVTVVRNGSERTFDVKLDARPMPRKSPRSFFIPETMGPEERVAIEKSVREAVESAHKALREANEQLRVQSDRLRIEQNEVREQIQKQLMELKEKLKDNTAPVIRARTIHDI